jgi:hypothetical protein
MRDVRIYRTRAQRESTKAATTDIKQPDMAVIGDSNAGKPEEPAGLTQQETNESMTDHDSRISSDHIFYGDHKNAVEGPIAGEDNSISNTHLKGGEGKVDQVGNQSNGEFENLNPGQTMKFGNWIISRSSNDETFKVEMPFETVNDVKDHPQKESGKAVKIVSSTINKLLKSGGSTKLVVLFIDGEEEDLIDDIRGGSIE